MIWSRTTQKTSMNFILVYCFTQAFHSHDIRQGFDSPRVCEKVKWQNCFEFLVLAEGHLLLKQAVRIISHETYCSKQFSKILIAYRFQDFIIKQKRNISENVSIAFKLSENRRNLGGSKWREEIRSYISEKLILTKCLLLYPIYNIQFSLLKTHFKVTGIQVIITKLGY